MKASDLEILIYNPFHISKILHHFISGAFTVNDNGIKTELLNIVLPFVLDEKLFNKLQNLNKNSKLNSIIENQDYEVFINQLNHKIKQTLKATKNGIIVLSNETELEIHDFVTIEEIVNYTSETDPYLKKVYKSAYIFGILLAKERYLTVLRKLRITEL
jgi:hypothetical protein